MVSAHWTAPLMTPVMLGQYWRGSKKACICARRLPFNSRHQWSTPLWQNFYFILGDENIGIKSERLKGELLSKAPTKHGSIIPHICHLFYTGRIFESQYFTPKNYEKHPKITTNSPKKCEICSFRIQSGIFFYT